MKVHSCAPAWTLGTVIIANALALTLACALPESSTRGVTESPSLVVLGAPEEAILVVDGIRVGPATNYSESQSLAVLPGRHVVELTLDDRVLARREIFVDSQGIKEVDFSGVQP